MRNFLMIGLVLSLSACSGGSFGSGGRLNPFNWFGGGNSANEGRSALEPRRGYAADQEYLALADQITKISVERTPVGVIITATAVPPTQGWYDAELVRVQDDNTDEAIFEFRVQPPYSANPAGPVRSREITAGAFLTNQDVAGLRSFRVIGTRNALSARR